MINNDKSIIKRVLRMSFNTDYNYVNSQNRLCKHSSHRRRHYVKYKWRVSRSRRCAS